MNTNTCENCGSITTNKKFCSRSCSVTYNNITSPKRKPEHKCDHCSKPINARRKWCGDECKVKASTLKFTYSQNPLICTCGGPKTRYANGCVNCKNKFQWLLTLGELKSTANRDADVYNKLRLRSRRIALQNSEGQLSCVECGYAGIAIDIAHIKPLSQLSDDTTVWQAVNSENFLVLCKNHHYEFDNDAEYHSDLLTRKDSNLLPIG